MPHQYPLVPLGQTTTALAAPMDATTKKVLIFIGILLVAALLYAVFGPKRTVTRNATVKRMSTPDLAKNLYERLERRGGASETTMRSLKAYASKR
jgi:hypothetical protein